MATASIQAPSGFTYNGKHTSTMKLIYVPGPEDRGDFYSDYKVISRERSWYPGGEYFHSRVGSREFTLSCFYDMITRAEREAILRWFDRRTSGNLVFDDRPYVSYFVRPTKASKFKDYKETIDGYYSGTFTVTLTAFDPYGTLTVTTLGTATGSAYKDFILAETYAPYRSDDVNSTYSSIASNLSVFNPGTEVSDTVLQIRCNTGSQPLTITNLTTGQKFTLKAGLTMASGEYYYAYSETGRVIHHTTDDGDVLDFSFHDDGFLKLAPISPIAEGVTVNIDGARLTASDITFNESFVNTVIPYYPSNPSTESTKWPRVTRFVSAHELEISWEQHASTTTTLENVAFIPLNYFVVTKAPNATVYLLRVTAIPKMR